MPGAGGTTDQDVEKLIELLRRRDPQAMPLLFEALGRRAFGLAYRILGDGPEAEDVVQDAFLAVWRQSDRLDSERGSVAALLLTIVHRRAIDSARARRKRAVHEVSLQPEVDALDEVDVAAAAIATLDGAAAHRSMDLLPDDQRRVIELAYFDGFTHVEIAERLELPLGIVKSRMRLGLEKLREALKARTSSDVR